MATKMFLATSFLMMMTDCFAQTNSKYYTYPSSPPSYPPPSPNYYTQPKPSSYRNPPSYAPYSNPPSYAPYNNPPSYAPYSSSPPKYAPPTYAPYSPPSYTPYSQPSYAPTYNTVPSYGYPQGANYPYPQAPQSYASMLYPQPSNMYNYNANSYSSYKNCTDQTCATNECCEFNGVRYVCIQQLPTIAGFDQAAICTRFKRCYSNGDCPANHCCVVRLDILDATSNSYGSTYNTNYNSNSNYGSNNYKTERGECVVSQQAVGSACRRPVEGSATSSCPCNSPNTCSFESGNLLTGTCRAPGK